MKNTSINEKAGIGCKILQMIGQRSDNNSFEDAVDLAQENNQIDVEKYIAKTIKQAVKKMPHGENSIFQTRLDTLNDFTQEFKVWLKKNPKRYKKFFDICKNYYDRLNEMYKNYHDNMEIVSKFESQEFNRNSNCSDVEHQFKRVITTAESCLKSPCSTSDKSKIHMIIRICNIAIRISVQTKSVDTAAIPVRSSDIFMKFYNQYSGTGKFFNIDDPDERRLKNAIENPYD